MVKRDSDGLALDGAWKSAPWADPDGETVGATSPDDLGESEIQLLPSNVDPESLTGNQLGTLLLRGKNPLMSIKAIAESVGCSRRSVYNTLERYTSHERDPESYGWKSPSEKSYADLTDKQRLVIDTYAEKPDGQHKKLARDAEVSQPYFSNVLQTFPHIVHERRSDFESADAAEWTRGTSYLVPLPSDDDTGGDGE